MLLAPPPYGRALGLLELRSIARGIVVCDAIAKRAPVRFLRTEPVSPGKYLVVFDGAEAEVEEAFQAAVERGEESILDKLWLPNPHPQVWQALSGTLVRPELDSIAVVEAHTVAATVLAADACAKAADVQLFQLELAKGIGGKGWFAFSGSLDMVEAGAEAATKAIDTGLVAGVEVVPRPHEDLTQSALRARA